MFVSLPLVLKLMPWFHGTKEPVFMDQIKGKSTRFDPPKITMLEPIPLECTIFLCRFWFWCKNNLTYPTNPIGVWCAIFGGAMGQPCINIFLSCCT